MLYNNFFNNIDPSERLRIMRGVEEMLSLAVRKYAAVAGLNETAVRSTVSIRSIDQALRWIEIEFQDNLFHYRK
ncbi:MAG: hypothetical protein JW884_07650 [Deltaproteobacteria bacterium]|nr:hypothetical protein [Deltaproteobacteria bacterium]